MSTLPVPETLEEMAGTYRARNAVYGDNFLLVGKVMEALHGPGAPAPASMLVGTADQFNVFHLYELLVVKLTRFAVSGLTHEDSIHDLTVYGAMLEALIKQQKEQRKTNEQDFSDGIQQRPGSGARQATA